MWFKEMNGYNKFLTGVTDMFGSCFHAVIIDLNQVGSLEEIKSNKLKGRKKGLYLVSEFGTFKNRVLTFTILFPVPQLL